MYDQSVMAKNETLLVIIDTNLWISFIISKKFHLLDSVLFSGKVRLLFSRELIEEIRLTILKPKLKKHFGKNALDEMLLAFEPFIDFISVSSKINKCRDPKDDFLLQLAMMVKQII
jgi:putative PIN family toxin of toxin-antitoxin system